MMEVILLLDGLSSELSSQPQKASNPMNLVSGRPFLEYLMDHYIDQGVKRIIFSLGIKQDHISQHLGNQYRNARLDYVIEDPYLGSGRAVVNALKFVKSDHVIVVNGNYMFRTEIRDQLAIHISNEADLTMALKAQEKVKEYLHVDVDSNWEIESFQRNEKSKPGLIDGGIYILDVRKFKSHDFPEKFSIISDFLEKKVNELYFQAYISNNYFLDTTSTKDF